MTVDGEVNHLLDRIEVRVIEITKEPEHTWSQYLKKKYIKYIYYINIYFTPAAAIYKHVTKSKFVPLTEIEIFKLFVIS